MGDSEIGVVAGPVCPRDVVGLGPSASGIGDWEGERPGRGGTPFEAEVFPDSDLVVDGSRDLFPLDDVRGLSRVRRTAPIFLLPEFHIFAMESAGPREPIASFEGADSAVVDVASTVCL
jgi:hypothetical protein